MEKKVTVKDVAREAGVSVATVSYIMNNRTDQKISSQTRKKVLQIANLLNYRPSHAAKSLATGRNNIIGVAYHLNSNTPSRNLEITSFVNMLIERMNRMQYDVLFMPVKAVEDNLPINRNIDAIIAIDLSHEQFKAIAENYLVPVINVDMIVEDNLFYQIYSDFPSLISMAQKELETDDCYLILDEFANELYQKFITASFPKERILMLPDCSADTLTALGDKSVIVIGTYLALIVRPYINEKNMVVISSRETDHILSPDTKVVHNDISKKANLTMNILLNALDRNFDLAHDHKVL